MRFSVAKRIVVDPGKEQDILLYEVEPARRFKTESVYISFPAGTYSELEVSIFRGLKQVAPSNGVYQGDLQVIEDEFIEDMSSGEHIYVHVKNTNTTQTRECFVIVRGFLE